MKEQPASEVVLTPEQLARFDEASNHPYECKCEICKEWWKLMGPEREGDEEVDCYDSSCDWCKAPLIECTCDGGTEDAF